jgi:hypothetical protein
MLCEASHRKSISKKLNRNSEAGRALTLGTEYNKALVTE